MDCAQFNDGVMIHDNFERLWKEEIETHCSVQSLYGLKKRMKDLVRITSMLTKIQMQGLLNMKPGCKIVCHNVWLSPFLQIVVNTLMENCN